MYREMSIEINVIKIGTSHKNYSFMLLLLELLVLSPGVDFVSLPLDLSE